MDTVKPWFDVTFEPGIPNLLPQLTYLRQGERTAHCRLRTHRNHLGLDVSCSAKGPIGSIVGTSKWPISSNVKAL
jgi:hypothetical protein